ncbi:MADF domain-containing protein, partial [Aphis craccivora]
MIFLEEYQKYPCLWDKSLDEYRNRVKRDHAEEMLLQFSKMPTIKELRQKIRNIRCTYNQEVSKIKKSMVTGSGSSTVYKPKLSWFSLADSFLKTNNDGVYKPDTNLV